MSTKELYPLVSFTCIDHMGMGIPYYCMPIINGFFNNKEKIEK